MTPRLSQREMAERAKQRPKNWDAMDGQMQWAIDLELGILDWDWHRREARTGAAMKRDFRVYGYRHSHRHRG